MVMKQNIMAFIIYLALANSQIFQSVDSFEQTPRFGRRAFPQNFGYPSRPIYPPSTVEQSKCCTYNTISVSGSGIIQGTPDLAILNAQMTATGKTVKQAISLLTTQVNKILSILASNGLTEKNYQSIYVNVYPNTSWYNGVTTTNGQIANQNIRIEIPQIDADGSNIGKLIDEIATVNGITLNGISFDIRNKTQSFFKARQVAFKNAQRKALDYVDVLGLTLGKLITVSDRSSVAPVTQQLKQSSKLMRSSMAVEASESTEINVGTIPIQYTANLVYSYN